METMRDGLFWEVSERVVAFDWVEEPLRAQIPRLRAALRKNMPAARRSRSQQEANVDRHDDLVQPEPEVTTTG
jgi:hypothetical protein